MNITPSSTDATDGHLSYIEAPDYALIRDAFSQELQDTAQIKPKSLAFIRNILLTAPLVKPGELFSSVCYRGNEWRDGNRSL